MGCSRSTLGGVEPSCSVGAASDVQEAFDGCSGDADRAAETDHGEPGRAVGGEPGKRRSRVSSPPTRAGRQHEFDAHEILAFDLPIIWLSLPPKGGRALARRWPAMTARSMLM